MRLRDTRRQNRVREISSRRKNFNFGSPIFSRSRPFGQHCIVHAHLGNLTLSPWLVISMDPTVRNEIIANYCERVTKTTFRVL